MRMTMRSERGVIMERQKHPDGVVTVSDRAVMQIASFTARKCSGIAEMTDKTKKDSTARLVAGRGDTAGIYIKKNPNGVAIDIYAACRYGADVNALKKDVAESVRNAYCGTGINIAEVTVHINSVK